MEIWAFKEGKTEVIPKSFLQMPHILIQQRGNATWNRVTSFLRWRFEVGLDIYFFNISDIINILLGQVFHLTCTKQFILL